MRNVLFNIAYHTTRQMLRAKRGLKLIRNGIDSAAHASVRAVREGLGAARLEHALETRGTEHAVRNCTCSNCVLRTMNEG